MQDSAELATIAFSLYNIWIVLQGYFFQYRLTWDFILGDEWQEIIKNCQTKIVQQHNIFYICTNTINTSFSFHCKTSIQKFQTSWTKKIIYLVIPLNQTKAIIEFVNFTKSVFELKKTIVNSVRHRLIPFGPQKPSCVGSSLPSNFSHYTKVYLKQNKIVYWSMSWTLPALCFGKYCGCNSMHWAYFLTAMAGQENGW